MIRELFNANRFKDVTHYGKKNYKTLESEELFAYLSSSYLYLGQYDLSYKYSKKTLNINLNNIYANYNLYVFHHYKYEYEDAIIYCKKCVKIDKTYYKAYIALGNMYIEQKNMNNVEEQYSLAYIHSPNKEMIDVLKSFYYLNIKDYNKGFDLFRKRYSPSLSVAKQTSLIDSTRILNDKKDLEGNAIFINREQGLGDMIQFIRFAPLLKEKTRKVLVSLPASLSRLFIYSFPNIEFIIKNKEFAYTYHFPIMDMPYFLDISYKNIPSMKKYLNVNNGDSIEVSSTYLNNSNNKKRIGIVWKGNSTHKNDHLRSIKLEYFLSKIKDLNEDYNLFSLQLDITKEEKKILKKNNVKVFSHIKDFYDTALLVDNLDAVITVDTSLVHLCGAMNVNTYLLLSFIQDWRWGVNEAKTNWYESVSILRQDSLMQWDSVFYKLNKILK